MQQHIVRTYKELTVGSSEKVSRMNFGRNVITNKAMLLFKKLVETTLIPLNTFQQVLGKTNKCYPFLMQQQIVRTYKELTVGSSEKVGTMNFCRVHNCQESLRSDLGQSRPSHLVLTRAT